MTTITGIFPAMVTPMTDDGTQVNLAGTRALTRFLLDRGADGVFVCGGSGEGIVMDIDERKAVLEAVVAECAGRGRVIAHVGAHATHVVTELATHAATLDIAAIAAVPPFYFRTDASGLRAHYSLIAEAAPNTPLFVYNIPGATGVEVTASVVADLMHIPQVSGIKYSSYNLFDMRNIIELREGFTVLSGFDEVLVAGLTMGAHGGIGSTYNIMPATFAAIYRAYRAGDLASAQHFQYRANRVIKVLLGVPYFATLKGILSAWGVPCGAPRRPNRPFASTDEANASIRAMLNAGLEQLETDAMAFLR